MREWVRISAKPGPFRVTRWCCSGNCLKCRAAFVAGSRVRVVQMEGLNAEAAEAVRRGWESLGAEIEKN